MEDDFNPVKLLYLGVNVCFHCNCAFRIGLIIGIVLFLILNIGEVDYIFYECLLEYPFNFGIFFFR